MRRAKPTQSTSDVFDVQSTFNGAPVRVSNVGRMSVGQPFAVAFDEECRVVDVQSTRQMLRSLLSTVFSGPLKVALAVRESTTVHTWTRLRSPIGASLNATLESTVYAAVDDQRNRPGGSLSGVFQHRSPGADLGVAPSTTVAISGSGTMDANIDADRVVRDDATTTLDVVVAPTSQAVALPSTVKMHGTVKMPARRKARTDRAAAHHDLRSRQSPPVSEAVTSAE